MWGSLLCVWTGILVGCYAACGNAASPDFQRDILPLLYSRCFSCHSEKSAEAKAGLRLDSALAIRESGVVVPGRPSESELLRRVSLPHSDENLMPPLQGGSLPLGEAERSMLNRWIADGATMGNWTKFSHRQPATNLNGAPLRRTDAALVARQIDAMVAHFHETHGTRLNAPIDDETFLRRVYLDVAGRIPSLVESTRFLADTAPDKRSRLIETLLDSEGFVSHMFNWKADQLRLVTKGFPGQPGWMYDAWVKNAIRSGMTYDEFVRRLVTAEGYLWENGAVGFYQRDLGMPLDHMSNLMRLFLGTRIECAQCHDHPFEPITQQDFYQLTAYTFGVSNLYSSSGYSTDNVKHWEELQNRLDTMQASVALRQAVSGAVAPLKRLTRDTEYELKYPASFAHNPALRSQAVEVRTLFGDEAPATAGKRREAFARWITSPRNPRFALNISNRLWKRVMGVGLIEPVDSLSPVNRPELPELVELLSQTMVRLGFDERAFLSVLLHTQLYQSESVRNDPEPGKAFAFFGPQLRRLSAEQIWDSLLVLLVQDLDQRHTYSDEQAFAIGRQWARLTEMSAEEILERAQEMTDAKIDLRRLTIEVDDRQRELRQAQDLGDAELTAKLQNRIAELTAAGERARSMLRIDGPTASKETDPRWRGISVSLVRAAEIPTPIPLGHFLRQFGQSDRREIEAANTAANVTHALALMNGDLTKHALNQGSYLRRQVQTFAEGDQRMRAIFQAILVRSPSEQEIDVCRRLSSESSESETDLIWSLLNTPEFLFIQ